MEHYGVRGIANKWIVNYLNGRQQYVQIDNAHTGYKEVIHGTTHGSVLGPRLSITYINDVYCIFIDVYLVGR